jgi:hypothetical protein
MIISSHLHVRLTSGVFPSCFPSKLLEAFPISQCVLYASLISYLMIWWLLQIKKFLIIQLTTFSYYFFSLPNILLSTMFSNALKPRTPPSEALYHVLHKSHVCHPLWEVYTETLVMAVTSPRQDTTEIVSAHYPWPETKWQLHLGLRVI